MLLVLGAFVLGVAGRPEKLKEEPRGFAEKIPPAEVFALLTGTGLFTFQNKAQCSSVSREQLIK